MVRKVTDIQYGFLTALCYNLGNPNISSCVNKKCYPMLRTLLYRLHLTRLSAQVDSSKLDRVLTHPFWGLLILIGILGLALGLTYAAALPASAWIYRSVILALNSTLTSALAGSPIWVRGIVVDGILAGAGTVLSFVPVLLIFFTILAILEASGYLARSSRVTDRYLYLLGLPGHACIPLSMGFGCNTSAILGCRILDDRRSRLLTMLLVPFIPCTSRLAVIAFLTPAFFGSAAGWITWGLISVNLLVLGIVGFFVNRIGKRRRRLMPIPKLPPIRMPAARAVGRYVWQNTAEFLAKAGTLILVFSVFTWALSYFPTGHVEESYLAYAGRLLAPIGAWAGLDDWRFIVALLSSLVTKENSIAVLGVLFPVAAGGPELSAQVALVLSPAARLAYLLIQMLFIPCAGTLTAIRQESGSWKLAAVVIGLMLCISMLVSVAVYQVSIGMI